MFLATAMAALGSDGNIVINEIMYHPPNDRDELQYVELFNPGSSEVDISRWSFTKGIKFTFPENATMAPGSYLVVCRDRAAFSKHYSREISALGDFSGKLSHRGDRLELSDSRKKLIDWVKYADQGDWPRSPDGYGPSLERISAQEPGQAAHNWAASRWVSAPKPWGTPGRVNDHCATNLSPAVTGVEFKSPSPDEKALVSALVADTDEVKTVNLLYRTAASGRETEEVAVPMKRISGDTKNGKYQGSIAGQPQGTLVRFRIKAEDANGAEGFYPSETEPRPAYSYCSFANTNDARVAFGFIINVGPPDKRPANRAKASARGQAPGLATRANAAFIYVPPDGAEVQTYDFVRVPSRKGGYKIHFQKDHPFKGMTGINLIFESSPRWVLAEPLSYELYRMAGVSAELTEHIRLWRDGRLLSYHLLVEQPNKSFLGRNGRDDTGNLYKLLWYGRDVIDKHEKKTNPSTGHGDLLQVLEGLKKRKGTEQWQFIQENFNVEELINYFAVNMCIQNWDGFHNNYFAYHDTGRTGKWEMYPWDEDKTWGDYDGASRRYDWFEMPLTFGMSGDRSPPLDSRSKANNHQGPFGGVSWWRGPGYFSGPILANPQFRQKFLERLRDICTTLFTEEKFWPVIDAMERRLEPEVRVRALAAGENVRQAVESFQADIQSFRNQVRNRRKFILSELSQESR